MAVNRDRIFLIVMSLYVAILILATIGEIFDVEPILNLFDLKKIFS